MDNVNIICVHILYTYYTTAKINFDHWIVTIHRNNPMVERYYFKRFLKSEKFQSKQILVIAVCEHFKITDKLA